MRRLFPLVSLLMIGFAACKVYDELLSFSIARGHTIILYPGFIQKDSTKNAVSNIDRFAAEFQANGTSTENVNSAKLTKLILYIDTSETKIKNFNFLTNAVTVGFAARGLRDTVIATCASVPRDVRSLNFVTTSSDLTSYVKKDSLRFIVTMSFDSTVSQATFHCSYIFEINANPL